MNRYKNENDNPRDAFILINTIEGIKNFPEEYFNANHIFKVLFLRWI